VGRVDRDFSDDELELVTALQSAVVASHGRFFRGSSESAVLTPRQHEILHLMRRGMTTGAIASRLQISESTVGKHLRDLYSRLDTHDRVSTVREAEVRGLLDGVAGEPWQDVRFH
jgi:DNA-binding NarL/FixJ family response regulator